MAVKRQDCCPRCYFQDGIDEALNYKLGSTKPLSCGRGHVYEDRGELSDLMTEMLKDKRSKEPPKAPAPIVQPLDVEKDITDPVGAETGLNTVGVSALKITPIDIARLQAVIGHFTDSSSLFGAVFALNQELVDTKELLARANAARAVRGAVTGQDKIRGVGGDVVIQLVVPERHVEPLKDIAEANGMSMERYINARAEDGMDSSWFY